MRTMRLISLVTVLVAGVLPGTAGAQEEPAAEAAGVNLAAVAEPSGSYVSGDTRLTALNDGHDPRNSRDNRRGSYGNWPRRGTQWVQYDWSRPISTNKIDVYWWADGRGVNVPKTCRLLYWAGDAFVPVGNPSGLGVARNQYNTTTFDEVATSRLRLEIDSNEAFSTGVLEWKVYDSGKSPDFPPTVTAGVDRVVVLGGKTYLNGAVRTLKDNAASVKAAWSKKSGPGTVTFENAGAAITTATFSTLGDYVLKLSAGEGSLSSSSTLNVQVVAPPPADRLDVVYTKKYKINSPLWNSRAKALIVNWIPHCIDQINRTDIPRGRGEGGIDNFIEAAKAVRDESHGPHKGYVFSNAWVHQTVESMCIALMVDPQGDQDIIKAQEKMKATLEDWIPKILAAQEPDGYLQTAYTLADRSRWSERWSPRNRGDHEGYVAGYFIESAINHYTLTNGTDKRLYEGARKLADCWVANLGPGKKEWYDGHQEMEQALVRFGRFVNDVEGNGRGDNYVRLAKFLLDCRRDGSEYDQSHVPVQQQYEAVGHAVRAAYSYSGTADVAAETHDLDYQSAVMSLWDSMVNRKYYVTGGIGSGETSEGFGPNYSLRHDAYCESCSTCGLIFFQYKMNLAYHEARYADLYEESMYNALLGSIDLAGRNFYYQNPLDSRGPRYDWHACPCCVGNIPRTLLMLPTWMYVKSKDSICVNLFIGSTVTVEDVAGTDVEMVQVTDYPWSGNVSLTVNPATGKDFTIRIRVPNRSVSELYTSTPDSDGIASLSVNSSAIKPNIEKGYAVITRTWKAGDKIDLALPMKVQRIKASDKIAATQGRVALRYGPLIYCAEAVDQSLDGILSPRAALTAAWKGDLLGGCVVLQGTWADGSALTAIPYYARSNRDPSDAGGATSGSDARGRSRRAISSSVWLRDQ